MLNVCSSSMDMLACSLQKVKACFHWVFPNAVCKRTSTGNPDHWLLCLSHYCISVHRYKFEEYPVKYQRFDIKKNISMPLLCRIGPLKIKRCYRIKWIWIKIAIWIVNLRKSRNRKNTFRNVMSSVENKILSLHEVFNVKPNHPLT